MKESDYLAESRLIAIEHMLIHTYNLIGRIVGATDAQMSDAEKEALELLKDNIVIGSEKLTPVQRDHLAAETLTSLERLFEMAQDMRRSDTRGQPGTAP